MLNVKGIDAIFQKGDGDDYKNKSRMYQDILIFGSMIQENEEFKLWDLARYLLYNNEELRDHYFKSELRKLTLLPTYMANPFLNAVSFAFNSVPYP
jgi:hypothetical protein